MQVPQRVTICGRDENLLYEHEVLLFTQVWLCNSLHWTPCLLFVHIWCHTLAHETHIDLMVDICRRDFQQTRCLCGEMQPRQQQYVVGSYDETLET